MCNYLDNKIFQVIKAESSEENPVYVVGGYVRDCLLKHDSKDIDIVVVGSGISLAKKVARSLGNIKVVQYPNFGTAMLRYRDMEIEFVGARKESYRRDSRKPIVENGTLEDDQKRRDFTINALAFSLNKNDFGRLVDPFDGVKDLENGIICTPLNPSITFSDDPLRMLRAIRFATRLNFTIEENTFKAISENADRIEIISNERITDEINKILLTDTPSKGFKLLDKAGLLKKILPELDGMKGVEVINGKAHKDNFYHSLKVLDNLSKRSDDLWLRWAALIHDIAKPATKKFIEGQGWTFHGHEFLGAKMVAGFFRRMKLPLNEKMKYVQKLVRLHLRPIVLSQEEVTDSAVRRLLFDSGDDIDDLLLLCESDITSKNDKKKARYLENLQVVRQKLKEIEEKDAIRNFQPPVSGDEIINTFGIKPGPVVGEIKSAIKEAILDGVIKNDHQEARDYMIKEGEKRGLKIN